MRMLRVGLVCGELDPVRDGVADYTRRLAQSLRTIGVDALTLTTFRLAEAHGDPAIGVTDSWAWRGIWQAARAIQRLDVDVVHVQFAPSAFQFSRAVGAMPQLLAGGPPLVVTVHEYATWTAQGILGAARSAAWSAVERRGWLDREALLLVPCGCRLLVTNSQHAAILAARWPARRDRMIEIPIGPNIRREQVSRDAIRRAVREELGTGPTAALVVFFGFLHPVKGLPRLIEAASYLQATYRDLRVVLAGGCESHSVAGADAMRLRAALEGAARRHGVHANVVITGYLAEAQISRLLQAADVAVFPFDSGVTLKSSSLLAALSHDVPTIATRTNRQDAHADDAVLWIPPQDTGALVAAIGRVLTETALPERMRRAGRALIAHHEWPHIAALHAEVYWETLEEEAGSTAATGLVRGSFVHPYPARAIGAQELPSHGMGGPRKLTQENAADVNV
ncbi:MAG: glycosyltransferase family 4 protein [Ktedonobacterales bacterium]